MDQLEKRNIRLWPRETLGGPDENCVPEPILLVVQPPPELANGTAVIICPGGAYSRLDELEGTTSAEWLCELGVTSFILRYRVARHPAPLMDAQRAVRIVRARADEWDIDPCKLGLWGFSAGGHLASTVATHFDCGDPAAQDPVERASCRPDFLILSYPVITMIPPYAHEGSRANLLGDQPDDDLVASLSNESMITSATPPTFMFHTDADPDVPSENSVLFYLGLRKARVPAELHIYAEGPHGVRMAADHPVLRHWPEQLALWLRSRRLLG